MSFKFDVRTKTITMAPGDTANLWIDVEWDRLAEGDVLLTSMRNAGYLATE